MTNRQGESLLDQMGTEHFDHGEPDASKSAIALCGSLSGSGTSGMKPGMHPRSILPTLHHLLHVVPGDVSQVPQQGQALARLLMMAGHLAPDPDTVVPCLSIKESQTSDQPLAEILIYVNLCLNYHLIYLEPYVDLPFTLSCTGKPPLSC
eukprot:1555712-Amphidinium_carterae.1